MSMIRQSELIIHKLNNFFQQINNNKQNSALPSDQLKQKSSTVKQNTQKFNITAIKNITISKKSQTIALINIENALIQMSKSKDALQLAFNKSNVARTDLPEIPRSILQYLQFMDYKIRKQFKSFTLLSLCGGADRANFVIDRNFERAFLTMTLEERIAYYGKYIDTVSKACQKVKRREVDLKNISSEYDSQQIAKLYQIPMKVGKGHKNLEEMTIILQDFKAKSKGKNIFNIDLNHYLLRKSKKKQLNYVLQATRATENDTVRFAFLSKEDQRKYFPIIQNQIYQSLYLSILKQVTDMYKRKSSQKLDQQGLKPIRLKDNTLHEAKLKAYDQEVSEILPPELVAQMGHLDTGFYIAHDNKSKGNYLSVPNQDTQRGRKTDLNKSVIQDIVKQRDDQQLDQQLTQFINDQNQQLQRRKQQLKTKASIQTPTLRPMQKSNKNIFKIILPTYSLRDVTRLHHFGSIYQSPKSQLYVYVNVRDHSLFKMQMVIELPLETVCRAIYNVQLWKYWHPEIDQGQIKVKISTENSCIVYQKTKAFSQWYKERDYLMLAHMFRLNNAYYIVQKSIENSTFIPFQSITRGKFLYIVWKVEPEPKSLKPKCKVTVELKANHEGLLNKNHQKQLTLRYLKGFENMEEYFKVVENQKKLTDIMGFQWVISDRDSYRVDANNQISNNLSYRTVDFQEGSQISEEQQIYYSIQDLSQQQKDVIKQQQQEVSQHEIQEPKVLPVASMLGNSQLMGKNGQIQVIDTNKQGLIILPKKYLKKKHIQAPFQTQKKLMEFQYDNIVEKDHWVLEKSGGLKLINQEKIAAQNNVLKFIMKTLKKNLFSGKGILNISLPVQIFNVDSNIQRLCQAMSLGPEFLQKVSANDIDKLERFRRVLGFGLSNSIIYFDVQKPFNPILGQTYQGFIRGCPIYGQQISHHPPISSILLIGRGYKVSANLQAKVHVHMNSGDGVNQGFYNVIFDDGHKIMFHTPPAEISGLAMGDRRFNIKDRGLYIDQQNGYFCQMRMQAAGGLFKKKRQFTDQIQGQIVKVRSQFIRKFLQAPIQKKPSPSKQDIISRLGQLGGRWPLDLKIDGKIYYDIRKDVPDRLIDDIYPLNSNSNYREDLFYRKKNDLSRSQIQKERLEVLQRGDRKLREKFHGPQH